MTTLAQRLREIRHSFETGSTSPEVIEVLNAHVDRLVASKPEGQALAVGDSAPMHHVVETDDGSKSLQELCGKRFLVLTWFRGNW